MILPYIGFDPNLTYFEHNLKPTGIPNVFIHGVGLDNTMWLPQKKNFQNNQLVFYDLLNHGKSKKGYKKLYFDDFADQLNKLIEYLNLKKINLIGFSIGAIIAQHFTSKYYDKINKLIIISSVFKRSPEQIIIVKNRYNMAAKGKNVTDDSINRWFNKSYLEKNSNVYEFFFNILEKKSNENFLPAYEIFVNAEKYPVNYSNFNMPSLIMTGKNDIGSTSEMSKMLHREIKNSQLHIIPNAKHMVTFEKSDLINNQISKFCSSSPVRSNLET